MSRPERSGFGSGVVTGLVVGLVVAAAVGVLTGLLIDDDREGSIAEAREVIEANYFRAVDERRLENASIRGMVDQLRRRHDDRFSHYFNAEQLEQFEAGVSGSFEGVGLTVSEVPRGLRVASVFPDTPAERSGIEEGDVITAVNGKSIAGVALEVSTARIKGPAGTEVELRVDPEGSRDPRNLTIERADVRVPAVLGELRKVDGQQVAYVRFRGFTEGSHGELRAEIERLYGRGAEGLVLDLRDNGGGLLNEAVLAASLFVEDGNVVSTSSRTQGDRDYEAVGDAIEPRPSVVLVDRDTASAAEILAAALKQYDLATVVGTRTYGKGTFQEVIRLGGGGALDLTVGQYLTADGTSILGEGVKPQVRVEDDPATPRRDEALERALRVLGRQL